MQCPRCQQDHPLPDAQFCPRCGAPVTRVEDSGPPAASYADLRRDLIEAREQQTATSEILRIISTSPAVLQPVLDTLVTSAARVCGAPDANLHLREGDFLPIMAHYGVLPITDHPFPVNRNSVVGQAVLDRQTIHIRDIAAAGDLPAAQERARQTGYHTILAVPLLRGDSSLGGFVLRRAEILPFSDSQIALLQTFADQAVIAIENVRLFKELEGRNRDLKEALDRQTATGEILRVISRSPTDGQPVFDVIVRSASALCDGADCIAVRFDGECTHLMARHNPRPGTVDAVAGGFPHHVGRTTATGRAILDRRIVQVADVLEDPTYDQRWARGAQMRSVLSVPMMRDGEVIGAISVSRSTPGLFSEGQVELLETFADQAVIAIENVRLFTELQTKNRALTEAHAQVTEALEQQTATSEILRVISQSPTDVQPVLDAVAENAARLCGADDAVIRRIEGGALRLVAQFGSIPAPDPIRPVSRDYPAGLSVIERRTIHIDDISSRLEAEFPRVSRGLRTVLATPLLREGVPIGAIVIRRAEMRPFTERQIELIETFADQAVIAIENARLFKELQEKNNALTEAHAQVTEALEQQTATSDILRVISRSPTDVQPVFDAIARNASRLCDGMWTVVVRYDGELIHLVADENPRVDPVTHQLRFPARLTHRSLAARPILEEKIVHITDVTRDPYVDQETMAALGLRAVLGVPMMLDGRPIGSINVSKDVAVPFTDRQIALLQTFADQAVIAIENVRLFKELDASNREIADKSRQLQVASQHKSEFLANMSHELRTPLNAIIGFSEVLTDRMFGELNEKQAEYLKDIYSSGTHLLSLINDILDLSKIEAGRMELELTDFHLPTALDNALTLVRERAGRRNITLQMSVDERLGQIQADERKIRQVVLNLLSNAIKFTPEGGRIEVGAVPKDGSVEVSVSDTGVGIAPEDQEAVFEEFRQVGTAEKKAEGTGLGLTLCRKFIELHGGRIWVRSQVGVGSTFTFTIPVRCAE